MHSWVEMSHNLTVVSSEADKICGSCGEKWVTCVGLEGLVSFLLAG